MRRYHKLRISIEFLLIHPCHFRFNYQNEKRKIEKESTIRFDMMNTVKEIAFFAAVERNKIPYKFVH